MKLNGFLSEFHQHDRIFALGVEQINYQQACVKIRALYRYLCDKNIKQVALYFNDAAYFSMALLACVAAKVDVYLPPLLNDLTINHLQNNEITLLLTDELNDYEGIDVFDINQWKNLKSDNINIDFYNNIQISLQTSGSSGHAKIVKKTWQQILSEAKALQSVIPKDVIENKSIVLSSVSPQHLYGFSFRIVLSLFWGLPVFSETLRFPELLLAKSQKFSSVLWVTSPTLLHTLNKGHDLFNVKKHVDLIVSSGAPLYVKCKENLNSFLRTPILEIYGSTETGIVAFRQQQKYWQFFPELQYCEEHKNNMHIQSPWCDGETLVDELTWHEDGFELLGRNDRILKLADKRLALAQIEQQLLTHEWISDIYLGKHPYDNHLVAWVALTALGIRIWRERGRKIMITELKKHILKQYDKIAVPRYWRFDVTLPRNSQSKLKNADFESIALYPVQKPILLKKEYINNDEYHIDAKIPLDLHYFNGHFDHFHLVPAVIQLKWVVSILKEIQWLNTDCRQMENLKFQSFLRPNDDVLMVFKRDCVRGKITFQFTSADQKISSGRLVL